MRESARARQCVPGVGGGGCPRSFGHSSSMMDSCDSCCIVSSRSGGGGMFVVDEMNVRGDGDGNWVLVSTDVHCLRTASQSAS